MRVYQINVVCGSGSTGRIAVDLSKAIESSGGQCRIAYGRGKEPYDVNAVKISNKFDLYWHAIMTRITDKHGLYSSKATKKLIMDIEKYAPDIIHLHNIHGYYVNYEMLFRFLKKYNKPVVWTMHDCWAFTGHCAHFVSVECKKWMTSCFGCPLKKQYPGALLLDNSKNNYRIKKRAFTGIEKLTVVTPSNWLKDVAEQSFFCENKIRVIENGIDTSIFKPTRSNFRDEKGISNKFVVLGVASVWTEKKGFSDFIRISQILDEEYQVILVGLTKKQINYLPQNVIGLEKTNDINELAKIYSAADVFVNPTYEDTYPTTNLEALACGTPVVTYETGGSVESIEQGGGICVARGNVKGLADAIEQLRAEPLSRELCSLKGQKSDKSLKYEKYIELYQEIIKQEF